MMARTGITSACEAEGTPEACAPIRMRARPANFSVRVFCLIDYPHLDQMIAAGVHTGFGDEWVRVGAVKMFCDGSISERTARLSQPYVGRPDDFGILVTTEEETLRSARKRIPPGWQIGTHANGDVAIDMMLRLYERCSASCRGAIHASASTLHRCQRSLIRRIKALGAIPTPFSTYVYYHGEKMHDYGAERLNRCSRCAAFSTPASVRHRRRTTRRGRSSR